MDTCGRPDCEPILQVRGKMGQGDYFDCRDFYDPDNGDADFHLKVELDDTNRDDIRVICRKCRVTTGWGKSTDKLTNGKTVDVSSETLNAWPTVMERHWKIKEAQRLLKEAGAWR